MKCVQGLVAFLICHVCFCFDSTELNNGTIEVPSLPRSPALIPTDPAESVAEEKTFSIKEILADGAVQSDTEPKVLVSNAPADSVAEQVPVSVEGVLALADGAVVSDNEPEALISNAFADAVGEQLPVSVKKVLGLADGAMVSDEESKASGDSNDEKSSLMRREAGSTGKDLEYMINEAQANLGRLNAMVEAEKVVKEHEKQEVIKQAKAKIRNLQAQLSASNADLSASVMCPGRNWTEKQCNYIGCCTFTATKECQSAIGSDLCTPGSLVTGLRMCQGHNFTADACSMVGCCTFDEIKGCQSAVGGNYCQVNAFVWQGDAQLATQWGTYKVASASGYLANSNLVVSPTR